MEGLLRGGEGVGLFFRLGLAGGNQRLRLLKLGCQRLDRVRELGGFGFRSISRLRCFLDRLRNRGGLVSRVGEFFGNDFDPFFKSGDRSCEFSNPLFGVGELLLDRGRIGFDLGKLGAACDVPDFHNAVPVSRENPLVVVAEGNTQDDVVRGRDRSDLLSVTFPDLHGLIPTD